MVSDLVGLVINNNNNDFGSHWVTHANGVVASTA